MSARPAAATAARDPRSGARLSARDLEALLFIGRWTPAQYQFALRVFAGLSETVASRCVQRLLKLDLIRVTRWNKIGLNMLQLRPAGAQLLISDGLAKENDLFVPRTPVAVQSIAHHLWTIDAALALLALPVPFDVVPCWALRRQHAGQRVPIADVLAVSRDGRRVIAVEVDLATERTKWLASKLQELSTSLCAVAGTAQPAIIVLTTGERRIASIRLQAADIGVPLIVEPLPKVVGRSAVVALTEIFLGRR